MAPFVIRATPTGVRAGTQARLGVIALTHGNEVIGAPIVNHLIESLLAGSLSPGFEVQFALGNVSAARANQRYIENDLNRSFGLNSTENPETIRAREIETFFFDKCDIVLDLHQTIQPSLSPFFFAHYYSLKELAFLDSINPGLPVIVTLDDKLHGQKGETTNEFLKSQDKFCLTVELGQKGFFEESFKCGVEVAKNFIRAVGEPTERFDQLTLSGIKSRLLKLEVGYRVQDPGSRLHPGIVNLQEVNKGDEIGVSDRGPIVAPISGYILFPKYNSNLTIGQELFCLCREIQPGELSQQGNTGRYNIR